MKSPRTRICLGFALIVTFSAHGALAGSPAQPTSAPANHGVLNNAVLNSLAARIAQAKDLMAQGQPEAAKALIEAIDNLEDLSASNDLNAAASLNTLAKVQSELGFPTKAISTGQLSLQIRERNLGPEDLAVADSLKDLAKYEILASNYTKAEPLLQRALAIKLTRLGDNHPDIAALYNSFGALYIYRQQLNQSEAYFLRSLQISEAATKPDQESISNSLLNLATLHSVKGNYVKAETFFQRLLTTRSLDLAKDDEFSGMIYNNLSMLHIKQGSPLKAIESARRAIEIYQKALPADHPDLANSLNNLGLAYMRQGKNDLGIGFLEQAFNMRSRTLPQDHPDLATSLNNGASVYLQQGLYSKAELLLNKSLIMHTKKHGYNSTNTAMVLHNLGMLLKLDLKRFQSAAGHLKRALDIRRKILGPKHPDVAASLGELGHIYVEQGQLNKGLTLHKQALAIRQHQLAPQHPDIGASLRNIGHIYNIQGHYEKASPLLQQSESILQKGYGAQSLDLEAVIWELSTTHLGLGQIDRALVALARALRIQLQWLTQELPLLSEETRKSQLRKSGLGWWKPFELVNYGAAARELALEVRLNRHGLLQEIEQRQSLLLVAGAAMQERLAQLRIITSELANFSLPAEQRRSLLQQRDQLQSELYRHIPELKIPTVKVAEVAAALPSNGVLVEFQRFQPWQPWDFRRPWGQRWGEPAYLALILKPDGTISTVHLGAAKKLETQIRQALRATATSSLESQNLWAGISKILIKPLAGEITGVRQLFISPDGELNRIPFAALSAPSAAGLLLGEAFQLRLLTTGRELLTLSNQSPSKWKQSLVISNPTFSHKEPLGVATSTQAVSTLRNDESAGQQRAGEIKNLNWDSLPGTAREGAAISSLLRANLLEKEYATATSIQQAGAPRLIHIASHGFVLSDHDQGRTSDSPLLRSGIVLAGANQPNQDPQDDGYLTALEITQLNWRGTELVTLSSCQSGWSLIQAGEGVYGLKRAIAVAGARSSLLSFWLVDDTATATFMQRFYERLKTGEGRAEALTAVQAEFRQHSNPQWRHPYVWAAFQLSGDWRPISGL